MRTDQQKSKRDPQPASPAKRGLPPIVNPGARTLILGTLPGEESLRRQQYYGHPQNHFWPLIAAFAGAPPPLVYADRIALLTKSGFALWDVLLAAERIGSLDSAIRNSKPNDFATFFRANPSIDTIAFNGQKARAFFGTHVAEDREIVGRGFRLLVLPSTSPAYVKPLAEKLQLWHLALADRLAPGR
jgi:TDG/mug DNA glycosylase family protein